MHYSRKLFRTCALLAYMWKRPKAEIENVASRVWPEQRQTKRDFVKDATIRKLVHDTNRWLEKINCNYALRIAHGYVHFGPLKLPHRERT